MPNAPHEALHRIFQNDADLVARALFQVSGADLQVSKVAELNVDATEFRPLERRPDTVLKIETARHPPFLLVVESQTDPDPEKEETWPQLITYLRAKYHLPAVLLVITQKRSTAAWARRTIEWGLPGLLPSGTLTAHVFGPDRAPKITDLAEARVHVPFTVLSAQVQARSPEIGAILEVLIEALGTLDEKTAISYAEYTEAALQSTPAALTKWKAHMKTSTQPFVSTLRAELRAEGLAEGLAEGEAKILLLILEKRGIALTEEARARITGCTDTAQLETWARRALEITALDQLFTG
ncbi:hypothetical protein ABGB12_25070 [Actinocorallia sp. B10E7]|uniref:hypothetical protein n=1 Tax=Actinocorallia sp. B10E7 TaxID=3153558 RepID=UPI00325F90AC